MNLHPSPSETFPAAFGRICALKYPRQMAAFFGRAAGRTIESPPTKTSSTGLVWLKICESTARRSFFRLPIFVLNSLFSCRFLANYLETFCRRHVDWLPSIIVWDFPHNSGQIPLNFRWKNKMKAMLVSIERTLRKTQDNLRKHKNCTLLVWNDANVCKSCRYSKLGKLDNGYVVAKIGSDTAENEPCKVG